MKKRKRILSMLLAASMVLTTGMVSVPKTAKAAGAEADSSLPTLTVNMIPEEERELKHGASGWLYGQGDEEVPTTNTMTPLKPHTAVQKAPNGMQHPNGDTLDVAESFLNAGGKDIQIYVPDYYALWFYEFSTTEEYLKILKMEAEACIEKGIAEDVVYVLYNEPNENWIGGSYTDPETGTVSAGWESLFWFWEDMYDLVVDVYEENGIETKPRFAGLNLAAYNESVMDSYIKFCVEHSCMPDVISWHDLSTWQFDAFGNEYNHYRSLEKKYLTEENAQKYGVDITPREIVINEYAAQAECSSPGDLVRWIGLFEEYNVSGCMPFWHLSNNLNGIAADNNEGNGGWWLYKWYGDMSGQYLPVTTSNAAKNDYYGVASLDNNKKSASVVFGGVNGSSNIVLKDIDSTETFLAEDKVHVKIEATDYTGFHGVAEEPRVVKEGAVEVVNGTAVIPVSDMLEMSAYRITVTQATEEEELGFLSTTWKQLYEAENAVLTGNAKASAPDGSMACSGRNKIGWLQSSNDAVEFHVNVPKEGYYKFDLVYTAANGCNTNDPDNNTPYTAYQDLLVDGTKAERMILPTTLNWSMGGMYSTFIQLTAGEHTIKVAGVDSVRSADVDCMYLSYQGPEESDTAFDKTYQAELSEFNELSGNQTALKTERDGNVDYVSGLEKVSVTKGGGLRFNVIVPDNGLYTLKLRYSSKAAAKANIYQDNDTVNLDNRTAVVALANTKNEWQNAYQTVFLQKGINIIDIDTDAAVRLDYLNVSKAAAEPAAVVEAESGTLTGDASVGNDTNVNSFASAGGYVEGMKAANGVEVIGPEDPDFEIYGLGRTVDLGEAVDKNSLTITVNVPTAGEYEMAVYQSNGELFGKHSYNAQMTERYASFSVNGGEAKKVVFRNTYSDETFRSQVIPVTLKAGKNTIKIYNDNSKVVTNGLHKGGSKIPANIDYNVLENYTPNFDRFEFYPATADIEIEDEDTFQVTAASSEGGVVAANKTKVEKGGTVRITFTPEENATLKKATVNGENIMDKLSEAGGVYVITDVWEDITVKGIFEGSEEKTEVLYSVNCGDVNPSTLSPGDVFGTNNSVTDQFYAADAKTGKKWGVVDTYQADSNYPDLLTGAKTWPCENDGATDSSSRAKSFRYARNQATSDVGVIYKFELEANKTYDLEMGFYVPSGWTNASYPRTMKLVLNGTVATGYENFAASNSATNPYIIKTTAKADADGNLEIQIGHAANAVWGPVVSYIDIMNVTEATEPVKVDKSELQALVDQYQDAKKKGTSDQDWHEFLNALENAKYVLGSDRFSQENVNASADRLEAAAGKLKEEEPAPPTELPFVDVKDSDWYYDAVYYNYLAGTMTGLDDTHFGPNQSLARAQFATILYRMNGTPKVEYKATFPDVQDGIWYTNAILWAADTKVVTGYTDSGKFGPSDNINREQMAVMMYRYADYKGYDTGNKADFGKFTDAGKVNDFAKDAMQWAVGNGIITGKNNGTVIDPQGNATRAECATIIMRFMEKFEK